MIIIIFFLFAGTTLVLYDGSPLHPHPASMWDLVDECGITVFGTRLLQTGLTKMLNLKSKC